jgi:hypothetical protein
VERLAKQDNRNKSELLREALRRYIEEREWRDVLKYAKKKSIQQGIFTEVERERGYNVAPIIPLTGVANSIGGKRATPFSYSIDKGHLK